MEEEEMRKKAGTSIEDEYYKKHNVEQWDKTYHKLV